MGHLWRPAAFSHTLNEIVWFNFVPVVDKWVGATVNVHVKKDVAVQPEQQIPGENVIVALFVLIKYKQVWW